MKMFKIKYNLLIFNMIFNLQQTLFKALEDLSTTLRSPTIINMQPILFLLPRRLRQYQKLVCGPDL